MRSLGVLAAIGAVCCASWVTAAPFDGTENRLRQYDEQAAPRQYRTGNNYDRPLTGPNRSSNGRAGYAGPPTGPASGAVPAEITGDGPVYDDYGDDHGGFNGYGGCNTCNACGGCGNWCDWSNGPPCGFWGRAEYLQWWVRGANTPALLTTSPDGTPSTVAGILPTATTLFGNERINSQGRSGGRFTVGYWFPGCDALGLENTFFFLGNSNQGYSASSDGSPILARPFFNTNTSKQDAVLIAFPNIVVGNVNITSSRQLWGNELNLRRALYMDDCRCLDVIAGYRFLYLSEGLQVGTNTTSINPDGQVPVGTTFNILDSFSTRNQFNGGQVGLNAQYFEGRWSLDLLAKVALGGVSQHVTINGSTVTTVPDGTPVTATGGILAQKSNIGTFNRNQFSVLPEVGANVHYQLSPLWRINCGYTFMAVTNVVRPGDQIDTHLDPNQFPPPATNGPFTFPKFAFHNSDIWIQGINLGVECNF